MRTVSLENRVKAAENRQLPFEFRSLVDPTPEEVAEAEKWKSERKNRHFLVVEYV